jgi:hypothetical protein
MRPLGNTRHPAGQPHPTNWQNPKVELTALPSRLKINGNALRLPCDDNFGLIAENGMI